MLQLLLRHHSSCAQTVILASFRFFQIALLVTLLCNILASMGKETLDTLTIFLRVILARLNVFAERVELRRISNSGGVPGLGIH